MRDHVLDLILGWKESLEKNTNLEKLWKYYIMFLEEPSQIIIQVKEDSEDYINVYRMIISPSKIEFEQTENILTPFLTIMRHRNDTKTIDFQDLNNIDDIMYRIEDFVSVLPDIKETKEESDVDSD